MFRFCQVLPCVWAYTVHALTILSTCIGLGASKRRGSKEKRSRLRNFSQSVFSLEVRRNALTERNFAPSTYKIELRAKLEKSDISDTLKRVAFEMQS